MVTTPVMPVCLAKVILLSCYTCRMAISETGLCQCGCGQPTKIAPETSRRDGLVKGMPKKYLHGHHLRGRTPGSYINRPGYRLVWAPTHPDAYKQKGYVLEHRLVMEQVLGRRLTPAE